MERLEASLEELLKMVQDLKQSSLSKHQHYENSSNESQSKPQKDLFPDSMVGVFGLDPSMQLSIRSYKVQGQS